METLMKGDIVVIPFPFSNLSDCKKRPSLVVANLNGEDVILCEITSKNRNDCDKILLTNDDNKNLPVDCFIRPSRLFTADKSLISYKLDSINENKIILVEDKLCEIFTR